MTFLIHHKYFGPTVSEKDSMTHLQVWPSLLHVPAVRARTHSSGINAPKLISGLDPYSIFSVPFLCVNNHWFAWRTNKFALAREILFCSALPSYSSCLPRTLEELFELTWRSSRALDLRGLLLSKLQRYKDSLVQAKRRCQRTLSRKTITNLNCTFVDNALVFIFPKLWGGAVALPLTTALLAYLGTVRGRILSLL